MRSTFCLLLVLASPLLSFGCSNDDTSAERRGDALPDPGSGGAADLGAPITFCDAVIVLRAKCQRCHQSPPQHGAPVPFLTYADTQAQYYMTDSKWSDSMFSQVGRDFMPDTSQNAPPTSIMPPVEPLTADEKATLMAWLEQGANPEGGTDCP